MPLSVTAGLVRRLTWLGCELCDYNTPLLAPDFGAQIAAEDFRVLWREICARLSNSPQHRFDLIDLPKMPETAGAQAHPMLALPVRLNPSGAYVADLHATWTEFYQVKRSSATRRRDRTKRKRLSERGNVAFVMPPDADEIARTLDILMAQKAKAFARMGVGNVFARAGHRDFFIDIATNPRTRPLTHVSRLDVGAIPAAVNFGLIFRGTIITCWRATTTAMSRASVPAPHTCAISSATPLGAAAGASTSPSATSATSSNGPTTRSGSTTTSPPQARAAGSCRR